MRALLASLALLVAGCGSGSPGGSALPRDELVEGCARLAACSGGATAATACAGFSPAAIAALPGSWRTAIRCANAAGGDCAAIRACLNGGSASSGCDPTAARRCNDEIHAWECFAALEFVTDCAADGLACADPGPDGVAACGAAVCIEEPATCQGERIVECDKGVRRPRVCPEGARCVEPAGAVATCVGTGAPCPPGTPKRCDGETILVTCEGGAEARTDCAAADWEQRCGGPADDRQCVGLGTECDPLTFQDRCNGVRLEYCQDGRVRGLDCTELGFTGCTVGGGVGPSTCRPAVVAPAADAAPVDAPAAPPSDATVGP